jgi:hypothetical protein
VGLAGNVAKVDISGDRSLAQLGLEDAQSARLIRQRNVDERVQTTRSAQSRVKLLRSVGSTDDENILL